MTAVCLTGTGVLLWLREVCLNWKIISPWLTIVFLNYSEQTNILSFSQKRCFKNGNYNSI
jgi:hypothetical protein